MDAWVSQAAGLFNGGRPELAEKVLEKALAAGHESPELRALRCRCLTARQRFEEAVRLDPNDSRHHYLRAVLRHARRQVAEALTCLEEALRLDPTSTAAAGFRADLLMARGHTDRAMDIARSALTQDPENAGLLETVAWAHLEKCDPALAEQTFREALRQDPTSASAREGLQAASERLYSWKIGAGMGLTAAFLAGAGWDGTLPAGLPAALVIGAVGAVASLLGLVRRQRLRGHAGCLLAAALLVGISMFFLFAFVINALEDAPPEPMRVKVLVVVGSALLAAGVAAAIEIRGRRIPR